LLRFPFVLALLPAVFNGERRLHLHPIIIIAAQQCRSADQKII
jgi:hypothetical protein